VVLDGNVDFGVARMGSPTSTLLTPSKSKSTITLPTSRIAGASTAAVAA